MIGERAAFRRVFTQGDFDRFARLTGDDNPIHCDPQFAKRSHFGATVSHGMLLYSCISKAFAELIPGPGAAQVAQELMFPNPTYAGDEITALTARLEIIRLRADKELVDLKSTITAADGRTVCDGAALVLVHNLETKMRNHA